MRTALLLLGLLSFGACQVRGQTGEPSSANAATAATSPTTTPAGGAPAATPDASPPAKLPTPTTEAECKSPACNGEWGRHGLSPKDSCLCRTKDGGKVCKDAADCQGECVLTEPPATEVVDKGPPQRGFFVGACSEFTTKFGCFARLGQGAGKAPVVLSDPPGKLCAD